MQSCCRCDQSELHSLDFLSLNPHEERQGAPGQHRAAKHSEVIEDFPEDTDINNNSGDTRRAISPRKLAKFQSVQGAQTSKTETECPRKSDATIPPRRHSLNMSCKAKAVQVMQPSSRQPCDACLSFCKLLWDKRSGNHRPSVRRSSVRRSSIRNSITCAPAAVSPNTPGDCNRDLMKEAALQGRYVVAFSELLKLESKGEGPCKVMNESSVERVRRIGQKYVVAHPLFDLKPSDCNIQESIEEAKLVWGMQIEGAMFRMAYTQDMDCDFVRTLAFDSNPDIEHLVNPDEMHVKLLGENHEHDATWQKFISSKIGTKSDDIIVQSCIDALDEPVGAICILDYSLDEEDTTTPSGVPVPPVEKSCSRCSYVLGARKLVPLRAPDGRIYGVRRTHACEIELPQIVASILSMMPSVIVKRLARGNFQHIAKSLPLVINASREVSQCMRRQPKATFYDQVRRRLGLPDENEIDSAELATETAAGG